MFGRKSLILSLLVVLSGVSACVGATPNGGMKRVGVASKEGADATVSDSQVSQEQSAGVAAVPDSSNGVGPIVGDGGNAADTNAGGGVNGADANGGELSPSLRWVVMGDFGLETIASVPECVAGTQQRSVCSNQNARCRSTFSTSCSSGDCRRIFKCLTGSTNSLIWFPMGDGATISQAANATPAYGLCALDSGIAGGSCVNANERCLSSFCTSGSGEDCGRRVFKCLISGVEGKLFYRWMGDKPVTELVGIPQCALQKNIAGSECFTDESKCVSSFFTDATETKRRLFKCTP